MNLPTPLALGLLALAATCASPARAQTTTSPPQFPGDGITVFGTGEVAARPNCVEIDMEISGKAELTGDALVKYRDARNRLKESIDKLELAELSIRERGVSVSVGNDINQQQRIINGVVQNPGKSQVDVSSSMRLQLNNVRDVPPDELVKTVGRLIDVAQDAGVNIGLSAAEIQMRQRYGIYDNQGTAVRFVLADLAELREKAYEAAVEDARLRAARLAKLNHLKLGPALSVQEIHVAGDAAASSKSVNPYLPAFMANTLADALETSEEPRISSKILANVPVQVKLQVRFAIEPAAAATAQN